MRKASIQFFEGIEEAVVPEIRLAKSKNSKSGQAVFTFQYPSVLKLKNFKEIDGMYLVDEEGEITVREINVAISKKDGKYTAIQAIYMWNTQQEFERFMRFANLYAQEQGLDYQEKKISDYDEQL